MGRDRVTLWSESSAAPAAAPARSGRQMRQQPIAVVKRDLKFVALKESSVLV
jgi:hypothetical protein